MAEMEARFSILDSQMKELREENSRLTNDVSNFTTLMSEREEEESCHFALKTPLSVLSSAGNRTSHYRTTPSKLGSNLDTCNGDITFQSTRDMTLQSTRDMNLQSTRDMNLQSTRTFGHDKSISRNWSEINPMFTSPVGRLFSPPGDDERLNESSGESKISHTMLLQQLTSIQNQLDVIRKQLTGSPTRKNNPPSVPNPFVFDSPSKSFTSPIPVHPSSSKSTPYLSSSLPAHTSIPLNFPSDEVKTPPRTDYYPGYRDSDFDRDTGETAWISNPLGKGNNENFKSNDKVSSGVSRFIYPASDRIVRVQSKKCSIDDDPLSNNGLITAASRCRDIANRDPANNDLSTALDKYLDVVKKLSSSTSKLDSRLEKENGVREEKKNASDFFKPIFH